jgi:hypothetical protein
VEMGIDDQPGNRALFLKSAARETILATPMHS